MNLKYVGIGLALISLSPVGVWAGLLSDEEARQGVLDLKAQQAVLSRQQQTMDERVTRMETALQGYPDLVMRLDNMSQDLAQMRGRLDSFANQLDAEDKRFHDLYIDLDSRLKTLEGGQPKVEGGSPKTEGNATPSVVGQPGVTTTPATGSLGGGQQGSVKFGTSSLGAATDGGGIQFSDPSVDYDAALSVFNAGNYAKSKKLFENFIKTNPMDDKVPNALYWIGMNQLLLKDYKGARATNQALFKKYPDSSKAPDGLLNLAAAWLGLGDSATAKATWKMIVAKYPESSAAVKAKTRLHNR